MALISRSRPPTTISVPGPRKRPDVRRQTWRLFEARHYDRPVRI